MKNGFFSYSWDDEEHKEWVMNLRNKLEADGIVTVIDRVDLSLGESIPRFMEQSIRNAAYILIVLTPEYKRKADNRMAELVMKILSSLERSSMVRTRENIYLFLQEAVGILLHQCGYSEEMALI